MFKETPEGQTHHYGDGCKPAHVDPQYDDIGASDHDWAMWVVVGLWLASLVVVAIIF